MDIFFMSILAGNVVVHLFFLIKNTVHSVKVSCKKKRRCCYKPKSKATQTDTVDFEVDTWKVVEDDSSNQQD